MYDEKKIIELAKIIESYCTDKSCEGCVFAIHNGYCELNHPHTWDLDELGVD